MLARSQHHYQDQNPGSLGLGEVQDALDLGMCPLFRGLAEPKVLKLARIDASVT
jgi:hypothetical protein